MKNFGYLIFLIYLLIGACSTQQQIKSNEPVSRKTETSKSADSQKVSATFIEANKEKVLGNFRQAASLFQQCLDLDPNHAPSMFELARIMRMQGNYNDAIRLVERAAEIDKENKWYNLLLADLYEITRQNGKALKVYERLLVFYPIELEYLQQMAMLYLRENKFTEAIQVYDRIEGITGFDEEIIIQKHKLYLLSNKPDQAIAEIKKLVSMNPNESRYYAMLAEMYLDAGDYKNAIENLEKIREIDPDNPYIHITLADYYKKTGNDERAFAELKKGFANPNLELDIKIQVMITHYTSDEIYGEFKPQAEELVSILAETHPADPRPLSLLADFFIKDEKFEEARELYRKVLQIDNSSYFLWETLLRLNAVLRDSVSLLNDSKMAIQLFPLQPLPYLFAGIASFQAEDHPQAARMFNNGKDLVVDDDELLVEFYMYLGDTYHQMKNHEASDQAYESALAIDPDNSYVLNNFSYYLSLRSQRLEYAEVMARRANELDPDNKHYLDTYGWVMYKMGNYQEAKKWIEKSLEHNASEHAVVLEHYGDVLYKLGNRDEARKYWEKAQEIGGGSEFLDKKVQDGTLYE